jgi:hypothetical protein
MQKPAATLIQLSIHVKKNINPSGDPVPLIWSLSKDLISNSVPSPVCRAVKNMESFQEEMSSYQSLTTHITSQSLDRLFTNLARPDFTPDLVEGTS